MIIPDEVRAFLKAADALRDQGLRINPLSEAESAAQSALMQEIDVARKLGLIVLDDAGDSNPYCFIGEGPARRMVVHFSHDSEPRIRYHNLEEFLATLRRARSAGVGIDDLALSPLEPHNDQAMLSAHIRLILASSDDDKALLLGLYVPLLAPDDGTTLSLCAAADDFLVREIVAVYLTEHCELEEYCGPEHRELARHLAADKYPQVARPARTALVVLERSPK
jgi:hypothetical protein